jgi:hypothetical protein
MTICKMNKMCKSRTSNIKKASSVASSHHQAAVLLILWGLVISLTNGWMAGRVYIYK